MKLKYDHFKFILSFSLLFTGLLLISLPSKSQIEWTEYPHKLKKEDQEKVKFGYLSVPENHEEPDSRKSQVAFSILKSQNNSDEAVLYLPGGPGGSFTNNMNDFLAIGPIQKILEHKDIVFLDPRGCGNSKPSLCDNLNETEVAYPNIFGRTEAEMEALLVKAVEECRDALVAANIDPRAYSSVAVAHDIELLRKVLGYRQWIVRGHSYGSYYGQSLIHHFPGTVKAGILSGLVPKGGIHTRVEFENMTGAIKKVIEACEKDPACSQNYPDLENRFLEVLDSLNKEPIKIEGFSNEPIMVDAQVFVLAIFAMIYTKDGMEVLPMLVEMTEQGNDWIFRPLAQSLLTWPIENDMLKIISLNDRATFAEPAGSHNYEDSFFQSVYQYCYND